MTESPRSVLGRLASWRTQQWYTWTLGGVTLFAIAAVLAVVGNGQIQEDDGKPTSAVGLLDSGFRLPYPESLAMLQEHADIIVVARASKRLGVREVFLGRTDPLGEAGLSHDIMLPVATYTLDVSDYVSGDGEKTIEVHVPLNIEQSDPSAFETGVERVWFLEYEPVWKLGGFSLHYGEGSILTQVGSEIRLGGSNGPSADFLRGQTIPELAALIAK